jgi:UDP-N-acetylmuramate--alanine ligase
MNNVLDNKKHIHFIGIGGSGMYPLAQILKSRGYYLTGSDNNETATLEAVRKMGIPVFFGQKAENISGADLVVYSAAIMNDNPELVAANNSDVTVIERSVLLGIISSWFKNAVCISGTHGKTTATSLLTQIFLIAGVDISAVVGGKIHVEDLMDGSGRLGKSETLVLEACEFKDTFLKLHPDISLILNIDNDHLDYFGTIENAMKSFTKFAENASKAIFLNGDDENTVHAVDNTNKVKVLGKKIVTFGVTATNNYYAYQLKLIDGKYNFSIVKDMRKLGNVTLNIPGKHNVYNAMAAAAVADFCGVPFEMIKKGIETFGGVGRRFEKIGEFLPKSFSSENGENSTVNAKTVHVFDDYAHHPTEIKATLKTAKELPYNRVIAVFQPFTFSRTSLLLDDFADALSLADICVLTDIMGGREKNTQQIFSRNLAEKIPNAVYFPQDESAEYTEERKYFNFNQVLDWLKQNTRPGDLVITLGCGDGNKVALRVTEDIVF